MPSPIRALLSIFAAAAVALASGASAQQPITLHGASQFNDDHAFTKALVRFEELVKKYYGKPINFVLHKNSELGLEKDYFAFMNQGISVDYGIVSPAHMSTFSKAAPFIDAPFLFRDLAHWNKVLDADTLKPVADEVSQKGDVMLIGFAGGGTRNIFANKPVHNMAEIKGLKIRVQGAPIWSKTFLAAGMAPTVIAYDEIYNAIQNGVINAGRERGRGRRGDEVLRGRAESDHDAARDHDPAALLFRQDVQAPAAGPAAGGDPRGQGSGCRTAARSSRARTARSSTRSRRPAS
jgi:TRAP-type C4-dicarboxylate transport system substrate-binding protein